MRNKDELTSKDSCISSAHSEEMVFVFLSRDAAAPRTIRLLADERIRLGLNHRYDSQIEEALSCANTMEEEHRKWRDQLKRESSRLEEST